MNTRSLFYPGAMLLPCGLLGAEGHDLVIQNAALTVKWHPVCGHFSLVARPSD
jgi:hypothetical protein